MIANVAIPTMTTTSTALVMVAWEFVGFTGVKLGETLGRGVTFGVLVEVGVGVGVGLGADDRLVIASTL